MLIAIREKTRGLAAALIVGIIIVVFSMWGIESYLRDTTNVLVAKGDNVEVPKRVYSRALERYKSSVPQQMWDSPFLKQQVVESLVNETLLVNETRSLGYRASDSLLTEYIREQSYFQTNGKFDSKMYKAALRSSNTSVSEYESQMRENLALEQLRAGYRNSVIVTDAAVNTALSLMMQERVVDYVTIVPARFKSAIKVSSKEAQDYYDINKARYQTEEQVKVEYIELSAKALAGSYQPGDEELREFYNQSDSVASLQKAKRRISHILIEGDDKAALDKANKLFKQIKAGTSFSAMAKKHSDDPGSAEKGGDLGDFKSGVMVKEFEEAAMAMKKKGEVVGPVKTQFGYHLIKLTRYKPAVRKPFSKVRGELVRQLRERKGEEQFFGLTESFYNLVYENPDGLEAAAQELGLKIHKSGFFGRTGSKSGITSKRPVIDAAFSAEVLDQGRNSESIELDDTTLVAVRLSEHKAPATKPFKLVRKEIENTIRDRKAADKVSETVGKLRTAAGKDGLIKSAAGLKLKVVKARRLKQEGNKGTEQALVSAVFSASRPQQGKAVIGNAELGARGSIVFALTGVIEGNPAKADAAARNKVREMLSKRQSNDYFANFQTGLRATAGVKIFPENL
jgi:peptidyl-prolyl cis-trans isomerase D